MHGPSLASHARLRRGQTPRRQLPTPRQPQMSQLLSPIARIHASSRSVLHATSLRFFCKIQARSRRRPIVAASGPTNATTPSPAQHRPNEPSRASGGPPSRPLAQHRKRTRRSGECGVSRRESLARTVAAHSFDLPQMYQRPLPVLEGRGRKRLNTHASFCRLYSVMWGGERCRLLRLRV